MNALYENQRVPHTTTNMHFRRRWPVLQVACCDAWEPRSKHALTLEAQHRMNLEKTAAFWGELWTDCPTLLPIISLQDHCHLKRHHCWWCCQQRVQKQTRHGCGWLFSAWPLARNRNGEDASHWLLKHVEKNPWRSVDMLALHKSHKQNLFWIHSFTPEKIHKVGSKAETSADTFHPGVTALLHSTAAATPACQAAWCQALGLWGSPKGEHAALT